MTEQEPGGLSPEQRAQFRSFVRTHHPDRGGDPEVFVAGLARFRELAERGPSAPAAPTRGPDRYDAPIEIVRDLPLPAKIVVALIRTVRRRRRLRVDRPTHPSSRGGRAASHQPRRTS